MIKLNKKELIKEHKHLIKLLKKSTKQQRLREARKQEKELKGYINK